MSKPIQSELSHRSDQSPGPSRGFGLIGGVFLLLTISIMALGFMSVALDSNRSTNADVASFRMRSAAETAVSLAVDTLWGEYLEFAGEQRSLDGFRTFLDTEGITRTSGEHSMLGRVELPARVDGLQSISGVNIEGLDVSRIDDGEATRITFTTTVSTRFKPSGGRSSEMLRKESAYTYSIEGGEWQGLDYALLANNINCVLCHASVDSAQRFYNHGPDNYGSYRRVKVGSLESIELRTSTNSSIAGTLYVAGVATDTQGNPIENWGNYSIHARQFDETGYLDEDTWGNTMVRSLSPASAHTPEQFENLYLEYGNSTDQVDGYLPESFPAVFPDDGGAHVPGFEVVDADAGNRRVDDSEFEAVAKDVTGSLAGGTIAVNEGNQITSVAQMDTFTEGNRTSLGSSVEGNVYLNGTIDDPILLNGDVAIHGDLVLTGYVKGEGTFRVSGNVYIPDDVRYADGVDTDAYRTYGESQDGTRNALAIASGGNIMIGHMFHPLRGEGKTTGDESGSFSFIMQELAIFNRKEWMKTQPLLPGPDDSPQEASTYSVENPLYEGGDYMPRYYAFDSSGTLPILNGTGYFDAATRSWRGPETTNDWDLDMLSLADPSDPTDPLLFNADGTARAFVSELTTTDDWVEFSVLRELMDRVMAQRSSRSDDPIEINATLYSNNSIFGIIPTSNAANGTNGRLRVNGTLIAADIGLLAPRRIELNFDPRGGSLLGLRSGGSISIRRVLLAPNL